MNEEFLHYLWKYKKFDFLNLKTTDQKPIVVLKVGAHNEERSGPDFFNAQLIIDNQKWAGTVEIHVKSSDWYSHHHEVDSAYDNVILHVVWEEDMEIFRKNNVLIPTLQLKDYIDDRLLLRYNVLYNTKNTSWIQCEKQLREVPYFTIANWQERLYFERLEQKSIWIDELLEKSSNHWEQVLFQMLAKNFGLKINDEAFFSMASSFNFSIFHKCTKSIHQLEALFYGQAKMLPEDSEIPYAQELLENYNFLKSKFNLDNQGVLPVDFFRLRPANFPTIRMSQLANLYVINSTLFSRVIETNSLLGFYKIFDVNTSDFWKTHYTFGKKSPARNKRLTKSFIHLILINTVIPLKFWYARSQGTDNTEELLGLIAQLPSEKNVIIRNFADLGILMDDALQSQSMIQLKHQYCDLKACLKCSIGNYLLNKEGDLG